jgi:HSP20 family molecular chaperone IbpA
MDYNSFWRTMVNNSKVTPKEVLSELQKTKQNMKTLKREDMYKQYGQMFDSIFEDLTKIFSEDEQPEINTEKSKGFSEKTGKIEIPLAGYSKADISVKLEKDILIVSNTNPNKPSKTLKYRIPGDIEEVSLSMENGLLTAMVKRPNLTPNIKWI